MRLNSDDRAHSRSLVSVRQREVGRGDAADPGVGGRRSRGGPSGGFASGDRQTGAKRGFGAMDPSRITIDIDDDGTLLVVRPRGDLDLATVTVVEEALERHCPGRRALVVDLSAWTSGAPVELWVKFIAA